MKIVGIDNGVTGSITIIDTKFGNAKYYKTPVFKSLNYQKTKQWLHRINVNELNEILKDVNLVPNSMVFIERPMINPTRFRNSLSAIRALEATLITLENLQLPYQYIDSKKWQKELLPSGLTGNLELKAASLEIAKRLFPYLNVKDADSILIAEHGRRLYAKQESISNEKSKSKK